MIIANTLSVLGVVTLFVTHIAAESYELPTKVYYDVNLSETLFQNFKLEHQKSYSEAEEEYRFQVFTENLKKINELNEIYDDTVFGLTSFADLTLDEFQKTFFGSKNFSDVEVIQVPVRDIPDELDYRKKRLVTTVKNQDSCATDYIFSAIGEIEGQYAKKHGKLISLSAQYPLDCEGVLTCEGHGDPLDVMSWLVTVPGALSEADYPKGDIQYECTANSSLGIAKVKSVKSFKLKTAAEVKQSLVDHGPLSIALYAGLEFQLYLGGVLNPRDCVRGPNFFLVLIGYGKHKVDYWLLKNSWNIGWGEGGFARLAVGKCGVGSYIVTSELL